MLKPFPSLTPLSLCSFNECGVVNLNRFIKIQQCTPDPCIEQTYEPELRLFKQGWGTGTSWTALRRCTTCGLI